MRLTGGLGGGYRATTEKEGNLVAHIILHSGSSHNDWTIQITIPKVAVNQSDVEMLEEDAKAIAEAWGDYFATARITEDNITKQSGPLLEMAKAAVKNGSELKWMLGDKMFSTWFEKHFIRGTLQLTLNGHKKELALTGTKAQFDVGWDGSVNLVAGKSYAATGTENSTPFSGNRSYKLPANPTNVNGSASDLVAIYLTDDSGGGYTYYQLRDLGQKLGFNVGYASGKGDYIMRKRGAENRPSFSLV